jgi:alkyl hydroperoxide reductase subunit AhpC
MSIARVGELAPAFTLPIFSPKAPDSMDLTASLSDYMGRWLVFFFYPMDFTFVCPTEINAVADRKGEFEDIGASVLGCSTDTIYTHRAWASTPRDRNGIAGLSYPLAADHSGEVAQSYGVLVPREHVALRGLFIIDPMGVLHHAVVHSLNVGRSVDETLRVVAALQTGALCPSDWRPGERTITAAPQRRAA